MKIYIFFLGTLLLSINHKASTQDLKLTDNQRNKLEQLKKEVRYNLTMNILPYWSSKMVDNVNGGFFGRIDGKNRFTLKMIKEGS